MLELRSRALRRVGRLLMLLVVAAAVYGAGRAWLRENLTETQRAVATRRLRDLARLSDPSTRWSPQSRRLLGEAGPRIREMLVERDSMLMRWPDADTLRVWIDAPAELVGWREANAALANAAIEAWLDTGLALAMLPAGSAAAANVRIRWTAQLQDDHLGTTDILFSDALGIREADLVIALRDQGGELLDPERLRAVLLHETGHLLGLGHTADESSIMHPRPRASRLSYSDLETVLFLYALPYGRVPAAD